MALTYKLDNIENYLDVCYIWANPDPMTEGYTSADAAIKDGWAASRVREVDGNVELSKLNPVTNVLIMGTMAAGINKIDEKSVAEFYARFTIVQAIDGGYVLNAEGKYTVTFEDIAAHIGLFTNAKAMTRTQWASVNITKGRAEELYQHGKFKIERMKRDG
jgi:hypothetical protein